MNSKRFILLVLAVFLTGSAISVFAAEPQRELIQVNGFAGEKSWEVKWIAPEATLRSKSEWASDREPPLSVTQAIKAARTHLKSLRRPDTLPVRSVTLQVPMHSNPHERIFFYFVSFDDASREEPPPEDVDVLVLLDGSIVLPVRSTK